jgi:hypothetical protein
VARSAGVVAVLVIVATAVAAIVATTRTGRIFERMHHELVDTLTAQLDARLAATTRQLCADLAGAQENEDWSALQAELPRLAAADPTLIRLAVSDDEGLVVADSDPARNGKPIDEGALVAAIKRADASERAATAATLQGGRPVRVSARRVPTAADQSRVVLVVGSAHASRGIASSLEALHGETVRGGWWLVGLGGLVTLVVAVGAVLLAGSSVARRLRLVAWRVAQLGRSDRATHVRLDGPSEMQLVGRELELAAERLAVSAEARQTQEREDADRRSFVALVRHAMVPELAAVRVPDTVEAASARGLAMQRLPDGTVAVLFVERVGVALEDALVVTELRAAALALWSLDPALTPAQLLSRLDATVRGGRRARAIAVSVRAESGGQALVIANAGARFPTVRAGGSERTLVVRGDRLGQPAQRAELKLTLAAGDALTFVSDRDGAAITLSLPSLSAA